VGATFRLVFSVTDTGGLSATAERIVTVVSPCPPDRPNLCPLDNSCSALGCGTAGALGPLLLPPSPSPPSIVLLTPSFAGGVFGDGGFWDDGFGDDGFGDGDEGGDGPAAGPAGGPGGLTAGQSGAGQAALTLEALFEEQVRPSAHPGPTLGVA
jgi:hypothetical protein